WEKLRLGNRWRNHWAESTSGCHSADYMTNRRSADTGKPTLARCPEGFYNPSKKREAPIRFSFWMKSTKWAVAYTVIRLRQCWKSWTRNRIFHSMTIIWSRVTICQKYFSSLQPTIYPTFRRHSATEWK